MGFTHVCFIIQGNEECACVVCVCASRLQGVVEVEM